MNHARGLPEESTYAPRLHAAVCLCLADIR